MIKRYLNTFKGSTESQRFRRFSFTLFALLYALIFSIYFAINETFSDPRIAILVDVTLGLIFAILVDITAGIGRKSPLFKDKIK